MTQTKHGPFPNCKTCGFPIDSGGFCGDGCKGGDAEMVPCKCTKCNPMIQTKLTRKLDTKADREYWAAREKEVEAMTQTDTSRRQLAEETAAKWTNEHVEQLAPLIESALTTLAKGYEKQLACLQRQLDAVDRVVGFPNDNGNGRIELIERIAHQVREEDARIAETAMFDGLPVDPHRRGFKSAQDKIAAAIRARQEK